MTPRGRAVLVVLTEPLDPAVPEASRHPVLLIPELDFCRLQPERPDVKTQKFSGMVVLAHPAPASEMRLHAMLSGAEMFMPRTQRSPG